MIITMMTIPSLTLMFHMSPEMANSTHTNISKNTRAFPTIIIIIHIIIHIIYALATTSEDSDLVVRTRSAKRTKRINNTLVLALPRTPT
jgi:hypothetical protein